MTCYLDLEGVINDFASLKSRRAPLEWHCLQHLPYLVLLTLSSTFTISNFVDFQIYLENILNTISIFCLSMWTLLPVL